MRGAEFVLSAFMNIYVDEKFATCYASLGEDTGRWFQPYSMLRLIQGGDYDSCGPYKLWTRSVHDVGIRV